jgi:hypothetical protein
MYAHPSFLRDNPKALLNLQKTTSKNKHGFVVEIPSIVPPRSVSPSLSHTFEDVHEKVVQSQPKVTKRPVSRKIVNPEQNPQWGICIDLVQRPTPVSPTRSQRVVSVCNESDSESKGGYNDRGRLDLLTFALEQEIACYHVY